MYKKRKLRKKLSNKLINYINNQFKKIIYKTIIILNNNK